jgi:flagellar basal-body rod modification protein FlgD
VTTTGSVTNGTTALDTTSTSTGDRTKDALGRDAFLQLLTTQLAHQDPMQPQADTEFIAQLAQFSSLEQLQQMHSTLDTIAATLTLPATDGQTSVTKE